MAEFKLLTRTSKELKIQDGGGKRSQAEGQVDHAEGKYVGNHESG